MTRARPNVRYGGVPIAHLLISRLQSVGLDVDRFGDDGTKPLSRLKAWVRAAPRPPAPAPWEGEGPSWK